MSRKQILHYGLWGVLILGMVTELALQTFWQNKFGIYKSPVIWIIAGISVSLAAFGLVGFKQPTVPLNKGNQVLRRLNWNPMLKYLTFVLLFALGAYWCGNFLDNIFERIPVDAKLSDIIPSLEMYVQRLLNGEQVYRPLPFDGYSVDPTYFPLLWAPYIFSDLLQIDYRWTAYGVFLIAIFLYQLKLLKQDIPIFEVLVKMSIPFVWLYVFTQFASGTLGMAVELLPIGFYLLLTLSIFNKRPWLMAIGILLCLLSRYAFTFWLPVYLLIYWIEYGFKNVFQVSFYVLLGVIGLYVLPFLSKDWMILKKGLDYYEKTAVGQWETQPWQAEGAKPFHLIQGLSVAVYFYDYQKYTVPDRLSFNRKVHITVCGITAILLLLGYFFFRKKGLNTKIYLIIGLKLYLVIFYGFFYVPFSYLFKIPLFLSIPILYNIPFFSKKRL